MKCPECGSECWRNEVDVGVGISTNEVLEIQNNIIVIGSRSNSSSNTSVVVNTTIGSGTVDVGSSVVIR